MQATPVLYRETTKSAPIPAEVIGYKHRRYIVREVGRLWPGIWLADFDQLILPKEAAA